MTQNASNSTTWPTMGRNCTQWHKNAYIGTKYNMRKTCPRGEEYLGIKIHMFTFKCTSCYCKISFKTDPKNSDYVVNEGGTRNYEALRDA